MKRGIMIGILFILCLTMITAKPLIVAHRGASAYEKENTLKAFDKAIELDATFVEFDVISFEKKLIVSHNKEESHLNLDQTLKHLSNKTKIIIDLKRKGYEEETLTLTKKYFNQEDMIITSQFTSSLKKIKEINPKIKTGLVLNKVNPQNILLWTSLGSFPYKRIKESEADFLFSSIKFLNKKFIQKAEERNIPLFVWTINDKEIAETLSKEKIVKGIVTDDPAIL
jgi:glycerophosphoryl diester phosphodiesterase